MVNQAYSFNIFVELEPRIFRADACRAHENLKKSAFRLLLLKITPNL